jgi:hypothetical protein
MSAGNLAESRSGMSDQPPPKKKKKLKPGEESAESDFEVTSTKTAAFPKVTLAKPKVHAPVVAQGAIHRRQHAEPPPGEPKKVYVPPGGLHPGAPPMTGFEKKALKSVFGGDEQLKSIKSFFTSTPDQSHDTDVDAPVFDGTVAAPGVEGRDLARAIKAPVQSREGNRSAETYLNVIHQFAVGVNPRYDPDGDKPRGHIFIWDVTRAMGAEIPHFLGIKELNLAQTVDWIRHDALMKGWQRADISLALQVAAAGAPVLAVPKEIKTKWIGVVRPNERAKDGKPLLSAAGKERGNGLTVQQAFGVFAVEYFVHG